MDIPRPLTLASPPGVTADPDSWSSLRRGQDVVVSDRRPQVLYIFHQRSGRCVGLVVECLTKTQHVYKKFLLEVLFSRDCSGKSSPDHPLRWGITDDLDHVACPGEIHVFLSLTKAVSQGVQATREAEDYIKRQFGSTQRRMQFSN